MFLLFSLAVELVVFRILGTMQTSTLLPPLGLSHKPIQWITGPIMFSPRTHQDIDAIPVHLLLKLQLEGHQLVMSPCIPIGTRQLGYHLRMSICMTWTRPDRMIPLLANT